MSIFAFIRRADNGSAKLTNAQVDANFDGLYRTSSNMLFNGSGEMQNNIWSTNIFTAKPTGDSSAPYFYNSAAFTGATTYYLDAGQITLEAGVPVTISGEIFTGTATAGNAYLKLEAFKADNSFIASVCSTPAVNFGNNWSFVKASGTTPANTAYVKLSRVADGSPVGPVSSFRFRRMKCEYGTAGYSPMSYEATLAWLYVNKANLSGAAYTGDISTTGQLTAATVSGANGAFTTRLIVQGPALTADWYNRQIVADGTANAEGAIGIRSYNVASIIRVNSSDGYFEAVTASAGAYTGWRGIAFATTSDEAIKENVQPLTNVLDTFLKLRPVSYNFKTGGHEKQWGFIAQDLAKLFPVFVNEGGRVDPLTGEVLQSNDTKGRPLLHINYANMVSLLSKAIIELNDKVESISQELSKLKAEKK